MPADPKVLSQLASFDPSASMIASLFTGFSKLDPAMAKMILDNFNPEMLEKMATWADVYAKSLNKLADLPPTVQIDPAYDVDFDTVMANTKWQGEKIEWSLLEHAQNRMTKALKAKNYLDGIKVGMSLAKVLTGG